jgi:exonuclease SbcD
MTFRFLHTADIHLDSPLRSLALRDPALAGLVGLATRQGFSRIVDLALSEAVDALLIAGDLYDGEQTSMKTARFIAEEFQRLDAAGIRVFLIRGNHDAMARISRELTFPPNVKLFGGRAEAISIERAPGDVPIVIHGLSFQERHAPESLLPKFRPPVADAVNIGMLHTSLAGAAGHDLYAPCSLADLQGANMHYWALGHVHQRAVYPASPGSGGALVVMPGMPQGRDINEAGAKSATLVTVGNDRRITIEERLTSIAEFARISVDLAGIAEWPEALGVLAGAMKAARQGAASEHLLLRVKITGATPLAFRLRRDADLLAAELAFRGEGLGNCWIEKIELECETMRAQEEITGDPVAELHALVSGEILGSEAYRAAARELVEGLHGDLPPEIRAMLGADEAEADVILTRLSREGMDDVLAHVQGAAKAGSESGSAGGFKAAGDFKGRDG